MYIQIGFCGRNNYGSHSGFYCRLRKRNILVAMGDNINVSLVQYLLKELQYLVHGIKETDETTNDFIIIEEFT